MKTVLRYTAQFEVRRLWTSEWSPETHHRVERFVFPNALSKTVPTTMGPTDTARPHTTPGVNTPATLQVDSRVPRPKCKGSPASTFTRRDHTTM